MAKGKAPPHAFKPGQSGNPSGRPKLPEDIKKSRRMNQIEVARILNRFVNLSLDELKAEMNNPETRAMELMIGKVMIKAMTDGDHTRFNFILDRMIGKVTDKVEHTLPKPTVIKLVDEDAAVVLGHEKGEEE